MSTRPQSSALPRWLRSPEMAVAMAALLLSVCGLFIAIYEASLIRRAQRVSVWPHVEISASINPRRVELRFENNGVGPARIQAAALRVDGRAMATWDDLLRSVTGSDEPEYDFVYSLINGRVLPPDSPETVFAISASSPATEEAVPELQQAILAGEIDVVTCYCSVYDECWVATLQDRMSRSRPGGAPAEARSVENCRGATRSGI